MKALIETSDAPMIIASFPAELQIAVARGLAYGFAGKEPEIRPELLLSDFDGRPEPETPPTFSGDSDFLEKRLTLMNRSLLELIAFETAIWIMRDQHEGFTHADGLLYDCESSLQLHVSEIGTNIGHDNAVEPASLHGAGKGMYQRLQQLGLTPVAGRWKVGSRGGQEIKFGWYLGRRWLTLFRVARRIACGDFTAVQSARDLFATALAEVQVISQDGDITN